MPRKSNGSEDGAANDEPGDAPNLRQGVDMTLNCGDLQPLKTAPMTTAPAFDIWLERQMKTLFAACDDEPDQALVELIRREFAKRDDKVTD